MIRRVVVVALAGLACREPPSPATPEWRLSEPPLVEIGAAGDPNTEFHRVAGAVRLSNGDLAVADGGSSQVRYFSADGSFLRGLGRQGAGPGEFQSMGRPIRFGDTLAIHDGRTSRLTLFLGDSLLDIRVIQADNSTQRFGIIDRLADGRWLGVTYVSPRFAPQAYRDSIAVGVLPASGAGAMQWLGWFPGPWIVSIEGKMVGMAGFFTWVHAAASEGQVVVLDGNQDRLRKFSPDGTEAPGGAIAVRGEPLTPEIVEQAKRRELEGPGAADVKRQWVDLRFGSDVLGERLPAFGSLRSDSRGLLWLESFRTEPSQPGRYFVFSIDAEPVAVVPVPAGFRATEIGEDYVVGVSTDADGVERVVMYRLTRR